MGYESIDEVMKRGSVPLDPTEFEDVVERNDALILDTRPSEEYLKEHIPGSIWIGIDGNFAPWVGALIADLEQIIVFVATEGREQEIVTRLARVGYDNAVGYLAGGIAAWKKAGCSTASLKSILAADFSDMILKEYESILDVRKTNEFQSAHIAEAANFPLDYLNENIDLLDHTKTYYLYCQGGYRSVIALSILRANGFNNIVNIAGGFEQLKNNLYQPSRA